MSIKSNDKQSKKNKITLTVGIEETGYFPFNFKENGEIKGFSIDVLNYIEANSNYDFEFTIVPWPRALALVAEGKVDLILTLFKTPKREQIYHFIEPSYAFEVNQLFTLAANKFAFNGRLQQLVPYSIGTVREYSYGEDFDKATYLNKYPALTEEVLLKRLLGKWVDVIVGNPLIFNRIINREGVSAMVEAIEPYIARTPVYMVLTRAREDSQAIKQTFDQLTQQLKGSPYYQVLLDKYQLNY